MQISQEVAFQLQAKNLLDPSQKTSLAEKALGQKRAQLIDALNQAVDAKQDTIAPELKAKIEALHSKNKDPIRYLQQFGEFQQRFYNQMTGYGDEYKAALDEVNLCKDTLSGKSTELASMKFTYEQIAAFVEAPHNDASMLAKQNLSKEETAMAYRVYGDSFLKERESYFESRLESIPQEAQGLTSLFKAYQQIYYGIWELDYKNSGIDMDKSFFLMDESCFIPKNSTDFLGDLSKALENFKNNMDRTQDIIDGMASSR